MISYSLRHTTTEELFPTGLHVIKDDQRGVLGTTAIRRSVEMENSDAEKIHDLMRSDFIKEPNVLKWNCDHVLQWLSSHGLSNLNGVVVTFKCITSW